MRSDVLQIAFCLNSLYKHDQPNIAWHQLTSLISKMGSELDLTTFNQLDDIQTRIRRAKAVLHENPDELAITTTRIYKLYFTTL